MARLADGWLASGYNTTPALFAQAWSDLGEYVSQQGREPSGFPNGIATMWTYVTEDRNESERVLSEILAPMLNRPVEELREKLPVGPAAECAEKLSQYGSAGAQRIFIWPIRDELSQLERFRQQVWPKVAP